ncbi:glycoside hydrolase family 32 protein, partial [Enterobacter cloacae]
SQIYQAQCVAVSEDGIHFEKKGIILPPPQGYMHFRDPKVWFQEGKWWMVVGARDEKDQGQVLLFSNDTLFEEGKQWR